VVKLNVLHGTRASKVLETSSILTINWGYDIQTGEFGLLWLRTIIIIGGDSCCGCGSCSSCCCYNQIWLECPIIALHDVMYFARKLGLPVPRLYTILYCQYFSVLGNFMLFFTTARGSELSTAAPLAGLLFSEKQSVRHQGAYKSTIVYRWVPQMAVDDRATRVAITDADRARRQCRDSASVANCHPGRRRTTASRFPATSGRTRRRRPCNQDEGCSRLRSRPQPLARSTWMRPSSSEPSTYSNYLYTLHKATSLSNITPPRRLRFNRRLSVCLSVCLFATSVQSCWSEVNEKFFH